MRRMPSASSSAKTQHFQASSSGGTTVGQRSVQTIWKPNLSRPVNTAAAEIARETLSGTNRSANSRDNRLPRKSLPAWSMIAQGGSFLSLSCQKADAPAFCYNR
jgi:hypothetical protein